MQILLFTTTVLENPPMLISKKCKFVILDVIVKVINAYS